MSEPKEQREARLNSRAGKEPLAAPGVALATRLTWKASREFRHDLFKLEVDKMKKNTSYKAYMPEIQLVEHAHFFHSHDMKGKANVHSAAVGGHFHEVTVEWGKAEDGTPTIKTAECGPALRFAQKRTRAGRSKTVIERVRYARGEAAADGSDDDAEISSYEEDNHRHDLTYMGSEMISPDRLKKQQDDDRAKLSAMIQADATTVGAPDKSRQAEKTGGDEALDADVDGVKIKDTD